MPGPPTPSAAADTVGATAASPHLAPLLTPQGRLVLCPDTQAQSFDSACAARLAEAFARGSGHGLLQLGAAEVDTLLPAVFAYWRDFAARYVTALCLLPEAEAAAAKLPPPPTEVLSALAAAAPPMAGADYLSAEVLARLWSELDTAFTAELTAETATEAATEAADGTASAGGRVERFLHRRNPAWNLVGRVHFNLAENPRDEAAPFAFVATYTTRLSSREQAQHRPQHVPLGRALQDFAGASNAELLALLLPVQRAAGHCAWLKAMVDSGEIFHPLRWTPAEAYALLRDAPALQAAGIVLRMPARWRSGRPARAQVSVTVGAAPPSSFGVDALLDFEMAVTLDGQTLGADEIAQLLAQSDGLALVRGQWIELDRKRLAATLDRFERIAQRARAEGLAFGEAMRLVAGAANEEAAATEVAGLDTEAWAQVKAGAWLAQTLQVLRSPQAQGAPDPGTALRATLRPYQQAGVQWLHLLSSLGLGACLADDMGLGKTIQVLALLLVLQRSQPGKPGRAGQGTAAAPSLLVAPASLLANWAGEVARFAPGLRVLLAHASAMSAAELKSLDATRLAGLDLVITSYGRVSRLPWLREATWRLVVIDEAQAIKNPGAQQTRAVKALRADARIALTGTPVENRLGDLWSIFDFINPGLLGSAKQFGALTRQLAHRAHNPYGPLRELVRPYILRRMKTDKSVIGDLPDKTELKAFCGLSRRQAALYEAAVQDLAERLAAADGIQRRGIVLAALMRFKQICNHPSQWLGDNAWAEADSGKWARLRELAEVIAAKQEKVLVFTQFREMAAPLSAFLATVFGRPGIQLHGQTPVKERQALVRRFQDDEFVPFFVLSLKAGGAGLTLTAASHVIHVDRWWNPAVEDQATDRAFRIGQKRNVLVHKFVCRGTVEEKIDALIDSKRRLATDLLEGGAETLLTELPDDELLALVALDIRTALQDA